MSQAPTLITQAETSALAIKTAADNFVGWLSSIRSDIAKCEAELEAKRRAANTELARLRADIERLQSERAEEERKLVQIRKDIERERKEIGAERKRLLATVEGVLGPRAA
jgi:predicted  nucleic acid-binding Zn-ribbon protein